MKNRYAILFAVLGLSVICLLGFQLYNPQPKVVFVDAETVFNEFTMTKELRKELEQITGARKNVLDSLQAVWKVLDDGKMKSYVEEQFYSKRKLFEEQNMDLTDKYDKQVWERLNQYIKDYGVEHKKDFIISTNMSGTLLYGNEKFNISKELIEYVNTRYKGN